MSSQMLHCAVDNLDETTDLAELVADILRPPLVVSLIGPLGAGKTQFVRCLAKAWEIDAQAVVSPTFSLCQTYAGRHRVHHLDAYRIKSDEEFLDLGPDELFEDQAITLIEWADRVADVLPDDRLEIRIDSLDIDRRRFAFSFHGDLDHEMVSRLEQAVSRFG